MAEYYKHVVRTPGADELALPCFMLAVGRHERAPGSVFQATPQRHTSIDVVERGRADLVFGERGNLRLSVPAGCAFIITPGTTYTYTGGPSGVTASWIDFNAPDLERFLESLSITRRGRPFPLKGAQLPRRIHALIDACERDPQGIGFLASRIIFSLALELARGNDVAHPDGARHPAVTAVLTRMREAYAQPLSLWELAESVHLDPSHLCRLFKNEIGVPPMGYLLRLRIRRAATLLSRSQDAIVQDVAAQVGFADANYFARVFKRVMGVAPSVYRGLGRR